MTTYQFNMIMGMLTLIASFLAGAHSSPVLAVALAIGSGINFIVAVFAAVREARS